MMKSDVYAAEVYCSHCGRKIYPEWARCESCGTPRPIQTASFEVPAEIHRWKWPAFWFGWIWALARGLYTVMGIWLGLYVLIWVAWLVSPFLALAALVLHFVAGAKGYEWDWRQGHWHSSEEFYFSYRRWYGLGWVIVIAAGITVLVPIVWALWSTR